MCNENYRTPQKATGSTPVLPAVSASPLELPGMLYAKTEPKPHPKAPMAFQGPQRAKTILKRSK